MRFGKRPERLKSQGSLKSSFTLWLCFAMLVTSLIVMTVDYNLITKRNTRALKTEVETKMARAVQTLGHPLWLYDVNFIREFAEILTNDRSVVRVTVIDERDRSLVDAENASAVPADNTSQWRMEEEIRFKDRKVGKLIMSFTNSEVSLLTRRIFLSDFIILFSVLLSVLGTTGFLINRQIFAPLKTLERTFHEISAGRYSRRVNLKMRNELAAIATEFNEMVKQVQLRENKIRESEIKYRNLIESSTEIIFTTDMKGSLIFMNPRFEKWTGHRIGDFLGRPFTRMFSAPFRILTEDRFRACLKGERIPLFEIEFETSDRTVVPMELNLTSQYDGANRQIGALGIARDITKRKESETMLRKYEQMIASTMDHMWLIDRNYRIQAVNDAFLNARHMSREETIDRSIADLNEWKRFETEIKPYVDCCLKGENVRRQSWFDFPDGGHRYMDMSYHPIYDADKQVSGVVISERDISKRKSLEDQLQQTQKMEAIGTLAGGIAHDFNNILSAIIGFGEMIEMFDVNGKPTLAARLEHILKGAYRAKDLVDQILTFSRHSDQEKKPLRLSPIFKEALYLLRASIPATIRIEEAIDCPEDVAMANPTHMHQVLMNLCANAAQSMEPGGGTLTVSLHQRNLEADGEDASIDAGLRPGSYIQLSISDTGSGIAAQEIERIFEPFYTTKKPGEGTGMGLAVVHGIVKDHHGTVKVESRTGQGSTFHVLLPRLDVEPESAHPVPVLPMPRGNGEILFVDDEKPLVAYSKEILEYLGYGVEARTSSMDALELFLSDPDRFQLVITDQTMPDMTGFDLAGKIHRVRPDLPIVLCTGFSSPGTEEMAAERGVRRFVKKPVGPRQLAEIVNQILSGPDGRSGAPPRLDQPGHE